MRGSQNDVRFARRSLLLMRPQSVRPSLQHLLVHAWQVETYEKDATIRHVCGARVLALFLANHQQEKAPSGTMVVLLTNRIHKRRANNNLTTHQALAQI